MATAIYSKAVLVGLQRHGVLASRVAEITGLTQAAIRKIIDLKASLTDRHLAAIERETAMSCGQLAMLSEAATDTDVVSVINVWADAMHPKTASVTHAHT